MLCWGRKRCRQIHPHERSVRYVSAGKGMYQEEMNGEVVSINNPNDANRLGIGMVPSAL